MASVVWNESMRGGVRDVESKFRGMWSPVVRAPAPISFVPVAPAMKPKAKNPPPKPSPLPRPTKKPETKIWCNVLDRYKDYRGCIAEDGTCYNSAGEIIGYMDLNSGEAGSVDSEYLGKVQKSPCGFEFMIEDDLGQHLAFMNRGNGYIKDANESTIVELGKTGEVHGHMGSFLGQFEGIVGYHDMEWIALWMIIIDPGMINEVEG